MHLIHHGSEDVEEGTNVATEEMVTPEEVDQVLGQENNGPPPLQLVRDPLEPHGHAPGEVGVGAEIAAAPRRARPPRQALCPHGARHDGRRPRPRPLVPRERPGQPRGAVVGRGRVGQARPRIGRHGGGRGRGRRGRRCHRKDGISRYGVDLVPEHGLMPVSPRRSFRRRAKCEK